MTKSLEELKAIFKKAVEKADAAYDRAFISTSYDAYDDYYVAQDIAKAAGAAVEDARHAKELNEGKAK